jgi:hypothetical protein
MLARWSYLVEAALDSSPGVHETAVYEINLGTQKVEHRWNSLWECLSALAQRRANEAMR